MILTCPECASRYFVDEAKLPPDGRIVRCSACRKSWRATSEAEPLVLQPVSPPPELTPKMRAKTLPKAFRQQAEEKRRTRKAMAAGAVWASLAAGFAVLMLSAVVFRVQVVKLWPRTAGAYAAIRLPVNPLGLAPDNIQAGQGLQNGHLALIVNGAERNVETVPHDPAPLRVSLYDKGGARLLSRVVRLADDPIAPGASRSFSISLLDPPMAGAQVGVDFVVETASRRRGPSGTASDPSAPPHLRGLEDPIPASLPRPTLARSVPASSPYALPAAARPQSD